METALQLVAFDIPYPPDYGGIIDIFYKIKALSESGVQIYLHCFEYNRARAVELEKYCAKVFYYPRKKGIRYFFSTKPYIVATRSNELLIRNLSEIKAPILFEGLHTCYYLNHKMLKGRVKMVRAHNIEHDYYHKLSTAEPNIFKKIFFMTEALKLKCYESILQKASHILAISPNDNFYLDKKFEKSLFVPAFHPFNEIKSKEGRGDFILFHGNLSVAENIKAVNYLLRNVLPKINYPVIIAGKDPSDRLKRKIGKCSHVQLIANPSGSQMDDLICNSHICLIPTFQDTGLKLKLLASLFSGRFCIANAAMFEKTGLGHLCYQANSPEEMIMQINNLFEHEFTSEEIKMRRIILEYDFSNHHNALKIKRLIQ